jgi:phenylacetate-CoA ligase
MGRTTDFIVRPDGAIMHALSVIYVLRAANGIEEFKIIQRSTEYLDVLIKPLSTWHDETKNIIRNQLRRRMGKDIKVEINIVDRIPPEASGKHRYVVSHVPLPDLLEVRN